MGLKVGPALEGDPGRSAHQSSPTNFVLCILLKITNTHSRAFLAATQLVLVLRCVFAIWRGVETQALSPSGTMCRIVM